MWRTKESTLTLSLSLRISPVWRPAGTWGFLPPSSSGASPSHPWLRLDVEVIKLNLNKKIETRKIVFAHCVPKQMLIFKMLSGSFTWLSDSFNSHPVPQEVFRQVLAQNVNVTCSVCLNSWFCISRWELQWNILPNQHLTLFVCTVIMICECDLYAHAEQFAYVPWYENKQRNHFLSCLFSCFDYTTIIHFRLFQQILVYLIIFFILHLIHSFN